MGNCTAHVKQQEIKRESEVTQTSKEPKETSEEIIRASTCQRAGSQKNCLAYVEEEEDPLDTDMDVLTSPPSKDIVKKTGGMPLFSDISQETDNQLSEDVAKKEMVSKEELGLTEPEVKRENTMDPKQDSECFPIPVQSCSGETITVQEKPSETVLDLKRKIPDTSLDDQCLIFASEQFNNKELILCNGQWPYSLLKEKPLCKKRRRASLEMLLDLDTKESIQETDHSKSHF